jgi:hypothetical protein
MSNRTVSVFYASHEKSRFEKSFRAGDRTTKDLVSCKSKSKRLILPMSSFHNAPRLLRNKAKNAIKSAFSSNSEKCVW